MAHGGLPNQEASCRFSRFGRFRSQCCCRCLSILIMDSPAVRAPDFPDTLDWIHTSGKHRSLADFRGRVLLLDFWTYG